MPVLKTMQGMFGKTYCKQIQPVSAPNLGKNPPNLEGEKHCLVFVFVCVFVVVIVHLHAHAHVHAHARACCPGHVSKLNPRNVRWDAAAKDQQCS